MSVRTSGRGWWTTSRPTTWSHWSPGGWSTPPTCAFTAPPASAPATGCLEGLRPVAGVPPYRALLLERRRVARDCFVSFQGSWYSAPAEYAGREVWVRQTEDQLVISDQDRVLARHLLAGQL
jgi:hypothetical protein